MTQRTGQWFDTGPGAWVKSQEEDKKAKERMQNRVFRFHLKNNEKAKVVFLDEILFFVHEHSTQIRPGIYEPFTCIDQIEECPECLRGGKKAYNVVSTIIRLTPIITKKGTEIKFAKQPIVFKTQAKDRIFEQLKVLNGTIKGCVFQCARGSSPTECSTGEGFIYLQRRVPDFEVLRKLCPEGVDFNEWIKPYNYPDMFKPMTADKMREMLGIQNPFGGATSAETQNTSNDLNDLFGTQQTGAPGSIDDIFGSGESKVQGDELGNLVVDDDDDIPF